jgi:hypothetical protein
MQVTIGGEPRTLGDFSAFKAFYAMQVLADAETVWRQVLHEAAEFKRGYEATNYVEMPRTEARREFPPRPLHEVIRRETEDGRIEVIETPKIQDGHAVLVDPLGHLSEEDWAASDQKLRVSDSPSERMQIAAMVPVAFRLGREELMRLLALVTTANADLERWDGDGQVDVELGKIADELKHRAKLDELADLAVAAMTLCREQVAGPFERLMTEVRTTFASRPTAPAQTTTPEPAAFETPPPAGDETPSSPTSSTGSGDGTGGTPRPSSTEPASAS